MSISVTSNGRHVVSGSRDKTLRVWDLASGASLRVIEGHTDEVWRVSVTSDDKRAMSISLDQTLRMWALERGECIAIYQARSGVISLSEMRKNGRFACGTAAGEVILLTPRNFPMDKFIATSLRIWLYGKEGHPGQWEKNITTVCQWCGKRFQVVEKILDVITWITRNANLSPRPVPLPRPP